MDEDQEDRPMLFTPLVRQPGVAIPDWLFGPGGVAGLPAPLHTPRGVNVAVGIDIIEVERVRKVFERHGERFLKRVFTEREVLQCRGKATRLAGRLVRVCTGWHGAKWRSCSCAADARPCVCTATLCCALSSSV
jgi:holo-[acyl-carrier protein] synthase